LYKEQIKSSLELSKSFLIVVTAAPNHVTGIAVNRAVGFIAKCRREDWSFDFEKLAE
jgi:hypothetical protein